MLKIHVPGRELFNDKTLEFIKSKGQDLQLEHSLVSLSKWESKWHKVFLSMEEKTTEETLDYIRCMTITQNVDPNVYLCLTEENIKEINNYIDDPMTATTFNTLHEDKSSREIVTSELIYYWMFKLNIPIKCEKWHINRLLTLIRIFNVKEAPPQKMSQREIMSRNAALNAARRKKLNTKG